MHRKISFCGDCLQLFDDHIDHLVIFANIQRQCMFHGIYQSLLYFYWSDYERIHLELATAFAMNQKRLLLNWFRASNYITCKMRLPCWLFGKGTEQTNTDPANLHKWYTILSCVLNTSHFLYEMYFLKHMQAFLIQLLLKILSATLWSSYKHQRIH